MVLRQMVGVKTRPVVKLGENEPRLVVLLERQDAAVQMIENAEFHHGDATRSDGETATRLYPAQEYSVSGMRRLPDHGFGAGGYTMKQATCTEEINSGRKPI